MIPELSSFQIQIFSTSFFLTPASPYLALRLKRISMIPANRQIIRVNEIFSASPNRAIPVVMINMHGPTRASNVLM